MDIKLKIIYIIYLHIPNIQTYASDKYNLADVSERKNLK